MTVIITDKLEVDGGLLLPPLSINAQSYTERREVEIRMCWHRGSSTRDLAYRRLCTYQLCHPFNHYLKDRVTNEANYNLILTAQLQSGRVVSYGSRGRSCGMSKFNDSVVRVWYIWVLCYCVTSLKAGFVICLNWYVVIFSRASLSGDIDSRTVNKKLATLTVWRLALVSIMYM